MVITRPVQSTRCRPWVKDSLSPVPGRGIISYHPSVIHLLSTHYNTYANKYVPQIEQQVPPCSPTGHRNIAPSGTNICRGSHACTQHFHGLKAHLSFIGWCLGDRERNAQYRCLRRDRSHTVPSFSTRLSPDVHPAPLPTLRSPPPRHWESSGSQISPSAFLILARSLETAQNNLCDGTTVRYLTANYLTELLQVECYVAIKKDLPKVCNNKSKGSSQD